MKNKIYRKRKNGNHEIVSFSLSMSFHLLLVPLFFWYEREFRRIKKKSLCERVRERESVRAQPLRRIYKKKNPRLINIRFSVVLIPLSLICLFYTLMLHTRNRWIIICGFETFWFKKKTTAAFWFSPAVAFRVFVRTHLPVELVMSSFSSFTSDTWRNQSRVSVKVCRAHFSPHFFFDQNALLCGVAQKSDVCRIKEDGAQFEWELSHHERVRMNSFLQRWKCSSDEVALDVWWLVRLVLLHISGISSAIRRNAVFIRRADLVAFFWFEMETASRQLLSTSSSPFFTHLFSGSSATN